MPEHAQAANRRIIGMVLLASAAVLGVVAILCATGVLGIAEQSRTITAIVLGVAALVDALIGMRFLLTSST